MQVRVAACEQQDFADLQQGYDSCLQDCNICCSSVSACCMFATITHPVTSRVPLKPLPIRETFSMSFKRTKLATAMLYAVGAISVAAQAQTPPPAPAQQVEGITVTGSRIPQPNLESTSPISVISAQDIKVTGLTSSEDLLNNLPQVFADYGGNLSNGATGTATVNLRNLGSARTLVLVNSRRMPAG